jgi:hypothetical protein
MKTSLRILLLIAAPLTPLHAQVIGAPPLSGMTREASVALVPRASTSVAEVGFAAGYRHAGRINLAAGVVHSGGAGHHSAMAFGTFGALPELVGVRAAVFAGVGIHTGKRGVFLPVGVDLARTYSVAGLETTPFVHLGASLDAMRPFRGHGGDLAAVGEIGADLRVDPRWSVRAGLGTPAGGRLTLGLAYGR